MNFTSQSISANTAAPTQLMSADPQDWPVSTGWQAVVDSFFAGSTGQKLLQFLQQRLDASAVIFPPAPLRALELTPPEDVRVVILGQDPYHGRGQAEGLAFSVAPGVRVPPSLQNIFKEMQRELGTPFPAFPQPGGSLVSWAQHGVLLLNTSLTVEEGQAASHAKKRLGRADRCHHPTCRRAGAAHGLHALGLARPVQACVHSSGSWPSGADEQPPFTVIGPEASCALYR